MSKRTVHGRIDLPDTGVPARAAAVVVRVEDVSRADAPSIVVGERRMADVAIGSRESLTYQVDVPAEELDERNLYVVSVHVDVTGAGEIRKGDLITMQSYPVLTRGHGDVVDVAVRRV